jgi:hypothetical protein
MKMSQRSERTESNRSDEEIIDISFESLELN